MNNWKNYLLFLIGMFSLTQIRIVGWIGITEVVLFFVAPLVFFKTRRSLKQHGFMPVLVLGVLWFGSALLTDWIRHNTYENLLKGAATPYAFFANIVCLHALLWDNVNRFKWAVVGIAVSLVLSIYVFQGGTGHSMAEAQGVTAEEAIKGYKLFGVIMFGTFLTLPIKTMYQKLPTYVTVTLLLFLAAYSLFSGGRSAFLVRLLSIWIVFMGGRKILTMRNIGKNLILFGISLSVVGLAASVIYKSAVYSGRLGLEERDKYEAQASSKIGLLSGRAEFVSALWAIKDSPLIGHGSWPIDFEGYTLRTVEMVGTDRDIELTRANYDEGRISWIPSHSYVWQSWIWHGLAGGIFWLYVFFRVYFKTFRECMGMFPQVFGYFAVMLPSEFWNVWFSPIGQRVEVAMVITLCLLAIDHEKAKRRFMRAQQDFGLMPGPVARQRGIRGV